MHDLLGLFEIFGYVLMIASAIGMIVYTVIYVDPIYFIFFTIGGAGVVLAARSRIILDITQSIEERKIVLFKPLKKSEISKQVIKEDPTIPEDIVISNKPSKAIPINLNQKTKQHHCEYC